MSSLSSLMQREQAQARASSKGIHFSATRPRPAERQDGGHRGAQAGVTTRAFSRRGPTLIRISVLDVPLQNGQLLAPFPLNIWEEARGLCLQIGLATHRVGHQREEIHIEDTEREATKLPLAVHRTNQEQTLARLFFPCTVPHQPQRQSTHHKLE